VKTKMMRVTMLASLGLVMLVMLSPMPVLAATCTWQGGGSGDWNTTSNWSCGAVPGAGDVVQFSSGGTVTVTGIPTQSIAQLLLSNNTTVNLQAGSNPVTLTVAGTTGTDLDVPSGSALNMNGATNILTLFLGSGATGSISGSMTCSTAAHKLNANDVSAITFNSGATFTQASGCTGNAFTNSGTANVIVFASGSTFVSQVGANPFGLSAPNSKVVFQTGSLYRHEQTGSPAFSGRTYANFELNSAAYNINSTGTSKATFDDLTVTAGSMGLNLTGGIDIKGNVSVASGATLNFNPSTANTITFNGTSAQTIGGAGTLTFGNNASVAISNTNGVTLQKDITLNNTLTLTSGDLNTGSNTLTLGSASTVAGTGDVVGNVRRAHTFSTGTNYPFNNANTLVNFSSVTNGASPSIVVNLSKSAPAGLTTAVPRTYAITPTNISSYDATLRLGYLDSETGGMTEANLRAWRHNGTRWVLQSGGVDTTNNYVYASNVTAFSNWAITDNGAPTAVTLSAFDARADAPNALPFVGLGALAVIVLSGVLWRGRAKDERQMT
jgi:hypothetical protein